MVSAAAVMSLGARALPSGSPAMTRGSGGPLTSKTLQLEQSAKLGAGRAGDTLLAAARQQAAGKTGDGRVARGMGRGKGGLAAHSGGEPAGHQRDGQQNDYGHHIGGPVHAQGVDRLGEEEIVGERRRHSARQCRAQAP